MMYIKSDLGLQAMKDRHAVDITRVQRSALILFDGQRSVRAVLEATAALGATAADVDQLVALGLLQPLAGAGAGTAPAAAAAPAAASAAAPAAAAAAAPAAAAAAGPRAAQAADPPSAQERAQRYRVAYPLATELTAQLGLRGFTLNLAVEAAQGFEGLVELLPRLRAAVGDERIQPLEDVLLGP
ncbi:hypothetical protein ACFOHU_00375 [Ottowia pentelensis]|uniref:Uncharacterized protein n=1 Tax=Ottowia pentelensis TaxID=511108 RepID=A0ABV6PPW2_9BURK